MTKDLKQFDRLKPNEQRGSKPRCHLLTDGSNEEVAARLTQLCSPFATLTAHDNWMPRGFEAVEECQLHRRSKVLDSHLCEELASWWLPKNQSSDRTPNFDIAATCLVENRPGLLLIEAKAHDKELISESKGRSIKVSDSNDSQDERDTSHKTIGIAIEQARVGLNAQTGLTFGISRDTCYQMSNRFAWAWKLADSGVPVVLMYLAFLSADDMADNRAPFRNANEWDSLVRAQSKDIVPEAIWDIQWNVSGQAFVPIIRSVLQPLG